MNKLNYPSSKLNINFLYTSIWSMGEDLFRYIILLRPSYKYLSILEEQYREIESSYIRSNKLDLVREHKLVCLSERIKDDLDNEINNNRVSNLEIRFIGTPFSKDFIEEEELIKYQEELRQLYTKMSNRLNEIFIISCGIDTFNPSKIIDINFNSRIYFYFPYLQNIGVLEELSKAYSRLLMYKLGYLEYKI